MASTYSALLGAFVALVLWSPVGWLLGARLGLPRGLALTVGPALGWAAQNVVALSLSLVLGLSAWTMLGAVALATCLALSLGRRAGGEGPSPPAWFFLAAAVLALLPAAGVLPKMVADGVALAAPAYDHAKVALVAEMVRDGVPPANPVFAEAGTAPGVAYYHLWHFGAAQLARLSGIGAWEADAASTWFTAFSSLLLVGGLAFGRGGRVLALPLALLACCAGSMRPVLAALLGPERLDPVLRPASGFAGWFFQTSWSPHHVASAGCVVLAVLVLAGLAGRVSALGTVLLALLVAAGFGSSLWVGGVTFLVAGAVLAVPLLRAARPRVLPFLGAALAAGLGALLLSAPLLAQQMQAAALRGGGAPVVLRPAPVLGPLVPEGWRLALDLPAFWLILLAVEFPALVAGGVALWRWRRAGTEPGAGRPETAAAPAGLPWPILGLLTLASLGCGWLLVSTAGENNDLGWRAILPALLVLAAAAGAGGAEWIARRPRLAVPALAALLAVGLPDTAELAAGNLLGQPSSDAAAFARAPALWEAVRRHAGPGERVANNPRALAAVTPWTVNIGWALLSDRRSCFAGHEMALAFAFLPEARRRRIAERFDRVFAGEGTAADVAEMAGTYGCAVIAVTPADGAWQRDPFGTGGHYRLAEERPDAWRIWRIAPAGPGSPSRPGAN